MPQGARSQNGRRRCRRPLTRTPAGMLDDGGAERGQRPSGGPTRLNRQAFDSRTARSETPMHRSGPHDRRRSPEPSPPEKETHVPVPHVPRPEDDGPRPLRPALRRLRPRAGPDRGRVLLQDHREDGRQQRRRRSPPARSAIKEERADLAKHHLDVLWHDYFKPEHLEKVPNLHELFWNATKQVSKVKASTDLADAKKLLDMIDEIDAAWKATGGEEKTRVAAGPA